MNTSIYPHIKRTFIILVFSFSFLFIQINLVASQSAIAAIFSDCNNPTCLTRIQTILQYQNELVKKDKIIKDLEEQIAAKTQLNLLQQGSYEQCQQTYEGNLKRMNKNKKDYDENLAVLNDKNEKNLHTIGLYKRLLLLITIASLALSTYLWQTQSNYHM